MSTNPQTVENDEFNDLINEIEGLQKELQDPENAAETPSEAAAPETTDETSHLSVVPDEPSTDADSLDFGEDSEIADLADAAPSGIDDFREGSNEGSLDDLGDVGEEAPAEGSLLAEEASAEEFPSDEEILDSPKQQAGAVVEEESSDTDITSEEVHVTDEDELEAAMNSDESEDDFNDQETLMNEQDSMSISENQKSDVFLKLTGEVGMKIEYEYQGETVFVEFGDRFVQVQFSDGTEFKLPVRKSIAA